MTDTERQEVLRRFSENRRHSQRLFDGVRERAYYSRPIPLRQPVVFYEGHFAAFNLNTLVKRALGGAGVNEELEVLFERGIDPESADEAQRAGSRWPDPTTVREFVRAADQRVQSALEDSNLEDASKPLPGSEAVFTILEHEEMHHETLRYMLHRLPISEKKLSGPASPTSGPAVRRAVIKIPSGPATIGADRGGLRFGWDNEFEQCRVEVPSFQIDAYPATNEDFLEFMGAGGYQRPELWSEEGWRWRQSEQVEHPLFWEWRDGKWMWRGMLRYYDLPLSWPVYVSYAEASAYAKWRGKRLPAEAEYHRAAFGTPAGEERPHPWGAEAPAEKHGNFGYRYDEPVPVGSFPDGQSAWGVHELVGNGWEWTASLFAPLPGFRPMPSYPQYSTDFFDHRHYVIKGASPSTAVSLIRRSFRNWFRPTYPYVYAKFRCVS